MNKNLFLYIVRQGIGKNHNNYTGVFGNLSHKDWENMAALSIKQRLSAVTLDGIEKLPEGHRPPQVLLQRWIGEKLQEESVFESHKKEAIKMEGTEKPLKIGRFLDY